ncbi:MAG: hypothetical protein Q4G39_06985 [Brachymonas sp.]|nr:hypothetical protein [Brachymonas sp.]
MKATAPAPAHIRLVRDGRLGFALALTLLALGALLLAWLYARHLAQGWNGLVSMLVGMAYAGCCWFTWRWWRALPQGWLVWTGLQWRLEPENAAVQAVRQEVPVFGRCTCALDLQSALLLHLEAGETPAQNSRTHANSAWVWTRAASDTANWHALRAAVVWAQQQDALAGALPTSGTRGQA